MSDVLSHQVCFNLLRQPLETNTVYLYYVYMFNI